MFDQEFKNYIIQSGVILGLVMGILTILGYFMGIEVLAGWTLTLVLLGLMIFPPAFYAHKWKKIKEFLSFKDALITIYLILALSMLILTIMEILLYNVVDTDLAVAMSDAKRKMVVGLSERMGAPESVIDEQLAELENLEEQFTVIGLLKSYLVMMGVLAIPSIIGAAIVKKNPPVFDQE